MEKDGDGTSVNFFSSKTDGFPCQRHLVPLKLRHVTGLFFFNISLVNSVSSECITCALLSFLDEA
jgi:hypothetical protein